MKILYLTYDGLSDPLGQSQVMPYLLGLADSGFEITIVSFEKKNATAALPGSIREKLKEKKIQWIPLKYTRQPPVLSTLFDILKLQWTCRRLQKQNKYQVVHCRSYITSFAGLRLKKRYGLKYIFDMRGFYADERVEGGLWNQRKLIYRLVYRFFKKKELAFLNSADKIVSLTVAAKKILCSDFNISDSKITVVPCCVDTDLFDSNRQDVHLRETFRKKLFIQVDDLVISYLGAIGTWYLPGEMLDFFKRLTATYPLAKFLFITHHPAYEIIELAVQKNIPKERIAVVKAMRNEVPVLLSLSRLSIFFILPSYSKIASSPTKQAEVLSMGIPVICNSKIGDTEEIIMSSGAGLLIHQFTNEEYDNVIQGIPALLKKDENEIRNYAMERFSLDVGVESYRQIYDELNK